jgi:hypothetical protein
MASVNVKPDGEPSAYRSATSGDLNLTQKSAWLWSALLKFPL